MILFALALLQAAAPVQTNTTAEPAAVPAAQPEETADATPPAPKMKRVCHTEMDPRVNTLASRHRVCSYVQADAAKDKAPR